MASAAEQPRQSDSGKPDGTDRTISASQPTSVEREVGFEHSLNLASVFTDLHTSLLVSTYQAGKLVMIGSADRQLTLSFHNFDRPMGVAIDRSTDRMAVAARSKVWFLRNDRNIAQKLSSSAGYDACFLTRSAQVTGEIQAHEMAWAQDELWIVNTLFSCLCTLHPDYSFVPRWQPPFISTLAPEDRCHLNGLAVLNGKPKYVTAMAESDSAEGWRPNKTETGCLIDVESGKTIARGFAMPHSPRVHLGHIWLLDSGRGALVRVDPENGEAFTVARFPGYTRGLAMIGKLAFVGLSKIRETSTFGGVPIAENRERLKCGIGVVNLETRELAAQFEFTSGVDEIFDIRLLSGGGSTAMRGPFSSEDGEQTIWTVPNPGEVRREKE